LLNRALLLTVDRYVMGFVTSASKPKKKYVLTQMNALKLVYQITTSILSLFAKVHIKHTARFINIDRHTDKIYVIREKQSL